MTAQTSQPAEPSSQRPRTRLFGVLLLVAAGLAIVLPLPYKALQSVGTQDGDHLTSTGYESRRAFLHLPTPRLDKGDRLLSVISDAHEAASLNHTGALRRGFALVAGLPGSFLLGRYPKAHE
jgi:hypothetical protein